MKNRSLANDVTCELSKYASKSDAEFLQRYFKTGKGEYGEGDIFMGVRVPMTRKVCAKYKNIPLKEIEKLLSSRVHEHRLAALIILTNKYEKGNEQERENIYNLYLLNLGKGNVNNWDLVDTSAHKIVGRHLNNRPKSILYKMAKSGNLWEKRVAIISTFWFLKDRESVATIRIAEILINDNHDLIQKAVGWALREVGKLKGESTLEDFLDKHASAMPRTALRYAIEKIDSEKRQHYMSIKNQGMR